MDLRTELLRMAEEDQRVRYALQSDASSHPAEIDSMNIVDARDTKRMMAIVDSLGWPGVSLVDEDGADAAWLLVQHADQDPAFQRRCLDLMTEAMPSGEVTPAHVAYLTDRVLLHEGKKQLYGTQFRVTDSGVVASPIEDVGHINERRKSVGLQSLEEYETRANSANGIPDSQ